MTFATGVQAGDFYVGLFGGLSMPGGELEARTTISATGSNIGAYFSSLTMRTAIYQRTHISEWRSDLENGWVIGASLGYDLANGPRIEAEETYRQYTSVSRGSSRAISRAHMRLYDSGAFTGTFDPIEQRNFDAENDSSKSIWSLMANVWWDFDAGALTPFVGGGLGVAFVDLEYSATEIASDFVGPVTCDRPDPYPDQCSTALPLAQLTVTDNSMALAYQVGAGVGWEVNESAILSAQYRYFGTLEPELANGQNGTESHEFLLGVNFPFQRN